MTALEAFELAKLNEPTNDIQIINIIWNEIKKAAKSGKWCTRVPINYEKDVIKRIRKILHKDGFHTIYNQNMNDKILIIDWRKVYEDEV